MPRPVPVWEQSPLTDPAFADNPLAGEYERFFERHGHLLPGKGTAALYRDTFAQFSAWLVDIGQPNSVGSFTRAALDAFRLYLETRPPGPGSRFAGNRMAPSTVHGHLRRLKTFCRFLTAAGYFGVNFCAKDASDLPLLPAIPAETRLVKVVTAPQLQRLVSHLLEADDPLASRDLALLLTAWVTGLRSGDLRQLTVGGLSLATRRCKVYGSKWRRDQEVAIDALAIPALAEYLALARPRLARRLALASQPDPGWLFLSDAAGTARNADGLLSEDAIAQMLTRRWNSAGLPGHFGAHRLRHGMATFMLEAGISLDTVKVWLGHSSTKVTEGYVHVAREVQVRQVAPALAASIKVGRAARKLGAVA